MIPFFFFSSLCAVRTIYVVALTDATFKRLVINRPKNAVWIVSFEKPDCPACRALAPKFQHAAQVSAGTFKFGSIDISRFPEIAKQFGVTSVPHVHIFSADGDVEYTGKREPKAIIETTLAYLKDFSLKVDESWLSTFLESPSAILFTEDKKTKSIWCGISSYFYGKSIRIGVCRDPKIAEKLEISDLPAVAFFNGTHSEIYQGKVSFKDIKIAMEEFFAKKLEKKIIDPMSVLLPDQFIDECVGGKTNCILSVSSGTSSEFLNVQKLYAHHKMKWFAGKQNLPYPIMEKKGGIWIYNPRRNGFIFVENVEQLHIELDHVLDGQGKWKKLEFYEQTEKEL